MGVSGLIAEKVRTALYDLEALGIASNDTALTAFVHVGVERSSQNRLDAGRRTGSGADRPDARGGAGSRTRRDAPLLHLRHATQHLKDAGHAHRPAAEACCASHEPRSDGRERGWRPGQPDACASSTQETVRVTLQRAWPALDKTARLRRPGAGRLLEHLLGLPAAGRARQGSTGRNHPRQAAGCAERRSRCSRRRSRT